MNPKFQTSVHRRDELTFVKLVGVIDEDNDLAGLTDKVSKGTCIVDLSEIERINSCGVRDWVNWLGDIEKRAVQPVFVKCAPAIVAQINLVHNFTGSGAVKSFYAPYFCPDHGEKLLLIEAAELADPPHKAPTCRCDECDTMMDFDDMEESYFAFLSSPKKIANADRIEKVVSEFNPNEEKSKIRSRVNTVSGAGSLSQVSLPSVPSLPHSSRVGASTGSGFGTAGTGAGTGSGTGAGRLPTGVGKPDPAADAARQQTARASGPPGGSSKMLFVLLGVIILAIGILAALLFSGGKKAPATSQSRASLQRPA